MKTHLLTFISGTAFSWATLSAQFSFADIKFWVGSGPDSAALVVDFHDGTWDSCYAWGFRFNGTATGEDMLNAVAAADVNFSVNISGGFLMDILYGAHSGIGGTNGFYWGTWSGPDLNNLSMNMGISTVLSHGDWFACSFTDFNPPLPPGTPIPAFEPFRFTAQDVAFWVGSGQDTTLLVIDFLDGSGASSFAWGYLHNGPVTAEVMLQDVAAADPQLNVAIAGGFLNDITYQNYAGIGGNPNYWATWSATNLGNWNLNMGISTTLGNGDLFGCSYTNFNPPVRPGYPQAALSSSTLSNAEVKKEWNLYPNPAHEIIYLSGKPFKPDSEIHASITDACGRKLMRQRITDSQFSMDVHSLSSGFYILSLEGEGGTSVITFIKR
jgi:hypothetical protein